MHKVLLFVGHTLPAALIPSDVVLASLLRSAQYIATCVIIADLLPESSVCLHDLQHLATVKYMYMHVVQEVDC